MALDKNRSTTSVCVYIYKYTLTHTQIYKYIKNQVNLLQIL